METEQNSSQPSGKSLWDLHRLEREGEVFRARRLLDQYLARLYREGSQGQLRDPRNPLPQDSPSDQEQDQKPSPTWRERHMPTWLLC